MVKQIKTVAVRTPLKAIPVPSVERIEGFTTTMYDMVKNVVTPAMISVRRDGGEASAAGIDWTRKNGRALTRIQKITQEKHR